MKSRRRPTLAVFVLDRLGADQSFVGDLLEQYEVRGSRGWLWWQVLASIPVLLRGSAQRTEPHRWRDVNLTAAPRGSHAGGLGLLCLAIVAAVVVPSAWMVVAAGLVGGMILGAGLIVANRRRHPRVPTSLRR